MVIPIILGKLSGDFLKLTVNAHFTANIEIALQCKRNCFVMLRAIFPQKRTAGVFPANRVRNIKNIAQPWRIASIVYKGDTFGTAPNIAAQGLVPQVEVGAGSGIRALGINHELLMVGIFVQARSGGEKSCPIPIAAGDLLSGLLGKLGVMLYIAGHGYFLLPVVIM
ncbi:hypothetical protein LJC34_04120 [Oscillospiraceae bacterium OttesenSCG-928-G22]|nr:hypothetical protein [Oscillospiraceae bacterium OttesenSCG-928-G22]